VEIFIWEHWFLLGYSLDIWAAADVDLAIFII